MYGHQFIHARLQTLVTELAKLSLGPGNKELLLCLQH